ncbi:hypothetical protein [Winogradskyella sp. A3E31]|uniref:hypothetical protein n=1 Tax=Winogradskyella sp. A3E31 TaxID=3349637 RepID=UPI00398B4F8B
MGTSKYFTLKEARLNNNCPECYSSEGLQLVFRQKFVENAFYKAVTLDTIKEMHCTNCNMEIFPVRWTDDIEQVVAYQTRAVNPKPKSIKLKTLTWILIVVDLILLVGIILYATGVI